MPPRTDCPSRWMRRATTFAWLLVSVPLVATSAPERNLSTDPSRAPAAPSYPIGGRAWQSTGWGAIRGTTIGPIENQLHPDRGYASVRYQHTLNKTRRLGANWISLTPFGRIWNLSPTGISLSFEVPYRMTRARVVDAVRQAHAEGLRVMLVPHLWVEDGQWRGEIDPKTGNGWLKWEEGYSEFLLAWTEVAKEAEVDMLAVGIELRSWVTTDRAPAMIDLVERVRQVFPGLLTYAANWDDVHDTVIWDKVDLIGLNAFFPLAQTEGAGGPEYLASSERIRTELMELSERWGKPILFTEFGYTSRKDPALRPWEWPEHLGRVSVDQNQQALAYRALLAAVKDQSWFAGAFVWRFYSDWDDVTQEPEWGFSPRAKLAELELRDAFASHWQSDGMRSLGTPLLRSAATFPGTRLPGSPPRP